MRGAKDGGHHSEDSLVQTYAINDAMNQLLLAHLDPRAWRAKLESERSSAKAGRPSKGRGSGRTIGAIFAHLHTCRLRWLRKSAPHLKCPAALDPHRCTIAEAKAALTKSGAQCVQMLAEALGDDGADGTRTGLKTGHYNFATPARAALRTGRHKPGRVTRFVRDTWMPVWYPDGAMFAYMFSHEAHHRGQILMLAHQLGYRLPAKIMGGIWNWDKLWKQQGIARKYIRQL